MSKNYGFNLDLELQHQQPEDYIFGATPLPCITDIKENEREAYLPVGEVQRGLEDTMDCASRGPLNILETKFNWLLSRHKLSPENENWLMDNGYVKDYGREGLCVEFSDAFVAINSHTTREGNSLKAPLQAIHEKGLIPKKLMPLESWMSFDYYHNPARITPELKKLGEEFVRRFLINYGKVMEEDYKEVIGQDMLVVGGYAWPQPVNGEYPHEEMAPNHCFILYKTPRYYAFDNYVDVVDGDYTKKLAPDYDFIDYGYRLIVQEKELKEVIEKGSKNVWVDLCMRLVAALTLLFKKK